MSDLFLLLPEHNLFPLQMPPHGIHPGMVLQHGAGMMQQQTGVDDEDDTEDMGEMDVCGLCEHRARTRFSFCATDV